MSTNHRPANRSRTSWSRRLTCGTTSFTPAATSGSSALEPASTTWLERSGNQQGYVTGLPTLWRLASGWYAGRLERGYIRRDPDAAAEYLRGAGLSGAFWGLTD